MTVEEWEALNDHRWYRESPVYSPILNVGGVDNVNPSILENWQRSARNIRGEMDIGDKTLHEVEEAVRRICFGEVFASFKEFELCLDCWCAVNMRASHKFKRNPDCRVRICRYELPARKKGVGKSCEWTPSEPSGSSQGLEPPHVLGVRSFIDFAAKRNTPAFATVRPDRPDLNLEEQVFSQCTQQRKKKVGVKGGCGEKDRYDAAQMVRFTHADSDGDDLDEEDIEGDEEDCDDDPKKVGRKTSSQGTRCEWRVRCQYNKKSDEYKIITLNLKHTCPGHLHKWRGPTSKSPWLAQIPSLCGRISEVDPSAVTDWHRFDGTCVFMRAFVCPSACRNVLRYCQKIVALDACFTKNKKYPTQLFIATIVYENSQMNVQKHFGTAAGKAFLTLVYMNSQAIYECRLVEMETEFPKARTLCDTYMWNYMLNLFYMRKEKACISSDELIEFATKRMKEIVQNCRSFIAMSADENEALV
ncbi:hypothetical protein R1sor_005811 [Riccia sorocarpa]|uniref:Uncharacterized protein n=1 Tax=Riccia sorocarpa TaxID=122646 RepID=A0ABD3HKK9_9MARC